MNRPLSLVSDSPSMEMDVVLVNRPLPLVLDLPSMEIDVVLL